MSLLGELRCLYVSLVVVVISACGGGGGSSSAPRDPRPEPIARGNIEIRLTLVAEGFVSPVSGTHAPNDSTRLFVVDQNGTVESIDLSTGQVTAFLDVSNRIIYSPQPGGTEERGILGLAFHPGYASNGLLYTYTSEPNSGVTDFPLQSSRTPAHQSVIAEWRVNNPANPSEAVDPSSRRELLRIDQPQNSHNAGALAFDNDGFLFISLGDGGFGDPAENSQNTANPLGAILRIDPDGNDSSNGNYGNPTSNPFLGLPGFLDEVFAFGFRNPFRISVDRITGDLWVGDVGEDAIEEVDRVTAGGNYGWNIKEGSFCVGGSSCDSTGLSDPVAEYAHDEGLAIIGGFVYRGSRLGNLVGRYVFGDFVGTGPFVNGSGRLFYLDGSTIFEFGLSDRTELSGNLIGFGEDADGELYVMTVAIGALTNTGQVYRVDPP